MREEKSGKGSCGCESVLSHGETINFAGIHVDRREDEPTSTIDGLCWPTVSQLLSFHLPYGATPYCAPFPLPVSSSVVPILPRDAPARRRRTWYNETALVDAFRAVSAAETCPGNGDFNTDVPDYQSQPLFDDGLSNAIIRSSVLELRQERVTRYLDARSTTRGGDRRDEGEWYAEKNTSQRGKLCRRRAVLRVWLGFSRGIWKNETTLRDRLDRLHELCISRKEPSAMRYRAEIRSRRSLRYSGADFVMEKSCYSILINNGGRARYGGENFKRASCPRSRIKLNLATKEIERKRERER